jgi:hypothetical protein
MKQSRFNTDQIIGILKEPKARVNPPDLVRKQTMDTISCEKAGDRICDVRLKRGERTLPPELLNTLRRT